MNRPLEFDEWGFTWEDKCLQLLELWMGVPLTFCFDHDEYAQVVDAGSGPGFTGARISWWSLSCGCGDADTSRDNLEAAR